MDGGGVGGGGFTAAPPRMPPPAHTALPPPPDPPPLPPPPGPPSAFLDAAVLPGGRERRYGGKGWVAPGGKGDVRGGGGQRGGDTPSGEKLPSPRGPSPPLHLGDSPAGRGEQAGQGGEGGRGGWGGSPLRKSGSEGKGGGAKGGIGGDGVVDANREGVASPWRGGGAEGGLGGVAGAPAVELETLNPIHHLPCPKPSTRNLEPETRIPNPESRIPNPDATSLSETEALQQESTKTPTDNLGELLEQASNRYLFLATQPSPTLAPLDTRPSPPPPHHSPLTTHHSTSFCAQGAENAGNHARRKAEEPSRRTDEQRSCSCLPACLCRCLSLCLSSCRLHVYLPAY